MKLLPIVIIAAVVVVVGGFVAWNAGVVVEPAMPDPEITVSAEQAAAEAADKCGDIMPDACDKLGMETEGKYLASNNDKFRALAMYEYACDQGYGEACFHMGQRHGDGFDQAVDPDEDKARAAYLRACMAGFDFACGLTG